MIQLKRVKTDEQIAYAAQLAQTIWRECYRSLLPSGQIEYMTEKYQSAGAIANDIANRQYAYYLILCDGSACGYMAVAPEGNELFLSKLYLCDWARGKGLGRQAMDFAVQLAKDTGKKAVRLTVNIGNERAVARYRAYGFEQIDHTVTDIGGGYQMDDYIMRKSVR